MLDEEAYRTIHRALEENLIPPVAPTVRGDVTAYDLTSRDRIIRGQMPTLDSINDRVASIFESGLAGRTRLPIRITASPATLLKFVDVNVLLAPPSNVAVLTLGPASGQALLVIEPGLAEALVAAALGGRQSIETGGQEEERELTAVDRSVLKKLLQIFTDGMAVAWAPILSLSPQVSRFESDPRLAIIAPPNEVAILCSFELTGPVEGRFDLAIPYAAVETAKKKLSSPPRLGGFEARFAKELIEELSQVEVEVRAILGTATTRISGLLSLKVGDVVSLSTTEGSALQIQVQGKPKLTGMPSVRGGNLAVEIVQALSAAKEVTGKDDSNQNGSPEAP
ncbi:MAG TPA: FliM/FliN family flagellar motor switch protein [Vulgatibacter sp.]|nr:FliM/FliN family flagellar motor switch protein [Vulgatibacter sp.]